MHELKLKLFRLPLLAIALAATLPFFAAADAPAPNTNQAQFEVDFFEMMIPHHTSGIALGELCLQRAVHSELRETCGKVVEDQKMERDMLRSWADDWYGEDIQPYIPSKDQADLNRLSQIQGEEFDKEFMQTLKMHHEEATAMASECTAKAYHDELKDVCDEMQQKQMEEIAMLDEWLCDWYGICEGTSRPPKSSGDWNDDGKDHSGNNRGNHDGWEQEDKGNKNADQDRKHEWSDSNNKDRNHDNNNDSWKSKHGDSDNRSHENDSGRWSKNQRWDAGRNEH